MSEDCWPFASLCKRSKNSLPRLSSELIETRSSRWRSVGIVSPDFAKFRLDLLKRLASPLSKLPRPEIRFNLERNA